tara:strand:- start:1586 stop:2062 length:477 start_codon:yes stop_codon:yes gene_type:complete
MNSRGNLLSIWWIFILGVVAGAIVIGVTIYYSADININEMHADVLGDRISKCIIKEDKLIIDVNNFYFFGQCKIDRGVFSDSNFFTKILIPDGDVIFDEVYGNAALEEDCRIIKEIESKSPLRCAERREVVNYNGNEVIVEITSGIKQEGVKGSIVDE